MAQNNQAPPQDGPQQAPPPTRQQQLVVARDNVSAMLDRYKGELAKALPSFLTAERMIRVVMTAASKTPALLECSSYSLMACVFTCAQLGLMPDSILGEAHLIPFNRGKGGKECQLIVGYKGLCALAYRSGLVAHIDVKAVYDSDVFDYEFGLDPFLKHKPSGEADPSKIVAFYCVTKMINGAKGFEVMTRAKVEAIRDKSPQFAAAIRNGTQSSTIWHNNFEEMGKKTVVRRTMKMMPLSPEIAKAVAIDEAAEVGSQDLKFDFMADMPDVTTEDIAAEIVNDEEAAQAEAAQGKESKAKDRAAEALKSTMEKMEKNK